MIRRNHIEAVTRIDRQVLRYEPKDSYRESAHKKYLKAESENMGEQTFRVTSSNKKYHQYKDWKQQHKTKPNEVQRKQSLRVAQQLSQFQTNQNECLNSLNRNYDRQAQEKIFDFSTLKTYNQPEITAKQNTFDNIRRKRLSQHHYRQSQPKSTEIQQNLQVQKLQNNQYLKTKYDSERYSPSKRNQNYASIQKYPQNKYPSSNKYYPPLFDSNLHNTSINKWQRPQIPNSAKAPGKIAYYQNSVKSRKQDTFRTFAVGGFEAEKTKKYALQEKREVKKLPLSKIQNQGEEVSEKLKKISQFNDQINQRIKNIITCFETLKGKI